MNDNIENKVIDISNTEDKITCNSNAEKEITDNAAVEKKKKKRKSRAKKKKGKGNLNAEKGTTDNVDAESETANVEGKTTDNITENKKDTVDANAVPKFSDANNAEKDIIDNANGEDEISNNADPEQEFPNDTDPNEYPILNEYLFHKTVYFVDNFQKYLMRCCDIFNLGCSDIEEAVIDLPESCKVLLRGSIGRYKSTNYYNNFYPYAHLQNGYEELKDRFCRELLRKTGISHSEFLRFGALYFLVAYDLNKYAQFNEALDSAFSALVDAIVSTKQLLFINVWYPFEE